MATLDNEEPWSVEMQREVPERVVTKWIKSLELIGRLALVLYSEESRQKQQMILYATPYKLLSGLSKLTILKPR